MEESKESVKVWDVSYSFPSNEKAILNEFSDIFTGTLYNEKPLFNFYEGPPFATGLPHYGHILTATIKDSICRTAVMSGYNVPRVSGFDCHGLPIEAITEKDLNLKSKDDIEEIGIEKFNDHCRSIVLKCESDWKKTITRMGRGLDWDKGYKTMDLDYMDGVWKVFSEINKKGLIYKGFRVMPYSWKCGTPISNFEAGSNYKDINDISVIVKFKTEIGIVLVWTTTPWTLLSNQALCVNEKIKYVEVHHEKSNEKYIVAEKLIKSIFKKDKVNIIKEVNLKGINYEPLFDIWKQDRYVILCDDYVSDKAGTGIVHMSPAFGDDDFRVCVENNIIKKDGTGMCMSIDDHANYVLECKYKGMNIFDANNNIIKDLGDKVFRKQSIMHSYPHCWRTDTKLIYRAVSSWFIEVTKIKDKLIENNSKVHWVPEHVGKSRFGSWLENTKDWNISRNRFWGCPIPVWESEDGEQLYVNSVEHLKELTGKDDITDIHPDKLTNIVKDGKVFMRINEVFDCWFESGSLPFCRGEYKQADFISEGLDQTRGWFYTLLIIGTILKNEAPYKNVIVNGLVLAEDGKKMSKRLKNYPNINYVINKYGSDCLRMYLLSGGAINAEPFKFKEEGLDIILRNMFIPLTNSVKFLKEVKENFRRSEKPYGTLKMNDSNHTDEWILSRVTSLKHIIKDLLKTYNLKGIVVKFSKLINDINNWYIKLNRRRLKDATNISECLRAIMTLHEVLHITSILFAPFAPLFADWLFRELENKKSVHYCQFSEIKEHTMRKDLEEQFSILKICCDNVRVLRGKLKLNMKRPIQSITVYFNDKDVINSISNILKSELNALNIIVKDSNEVFDVKNRFNFAKYGRSMGRYAKSIMTNYEATGSLKHDDMDLVIGDHIIKEYELKPEFKHLMVVKDTVITFEIDDSSSEIIEKIYFKNLLFREIQDMRKNMGLHMWNPIQLYYDGHKWLHDIDYSEILDNEPIYKTDITDECNIKSLEINDKQVILFIERL